MNLEELNATATSERLARTKKRHHLYVCVGTACQALNSEQIAKALQAELKQRGQAADAEVKCVGCPGLCSLGPLVEIESQVNGQAAAAEAKDDRRRSILYQFVKPEDAGEIVAHLDGEPVKRLETPLDQPFFTRQTKIVLEHCGKIDPERIEDYIAVGGYQALLKVLTEMTPQQVIDEITRSGLRGRGGAGFPTGLKWGTVAKSDPNAYPTHVPEGIQSRKFVICNGDEGDPGAFMDRSVMEGDPHRILEGMAIAAYAVGANQGFIYVRAEYPLAVKRLRTAIRQAQRAGLLGSGIGGTAFSFNVDIRLGAGAFVCGEETALIASIEGGRGVPRPRPPFPAESGLWGCPTLINNVETLANVPPIIMKGADWFAGIGTEKSKGTKVFALTGQVKNTGLIEVPMGISLREIVFDIGGGISGGRQFKAVQTGGPSGGCIPAQFLDMPVDYESLAKVGSIMGSGGMIVMDDSTDMVEVARFFMEFCMDESCGKCIPCRAGTVQMHRILTRIQEGRATRRDLHILEELCDMVKHTSLCGLGQSAPNPVISTLRYFREEYERKVNGEQKPEVRIQKPESRSQKPEARSQKPAIRS
ncbi:MAG: NADH-quinone oxidoreductase subunit NuoF [Chloroflexi bacterium]|uniref:NADH-quinone oxidoreductase subunit NuoF n=1 Tax=Candidatus Thermofonsia Clade 3 bacterium TaxID=2364212 RepID=A0A2M8QGL5_9CHLR|nr:MAG: NADH-quinone oxidoreductase subunit NuoF [Candidatus Thermofonsia Clade 3 bacterium]RMG65120.1 MAG: NADH-quinone oxidoreductase subunit NuoF [Chloroflexota bacterium]